MANTVKHAVVEIADLHATHGGHMFNFIDLANDYDNGVVLAKGDIDPVDYEIYKAKVPATTDEVMLVASVPTIPEARTKAEKAEHNFYNKAGEVMRAYQLAKHDRYAVSSLLITALAEDVVVGNYVVVGANGTYNEVVALADEKFAAKIERVVTKGYGAGADKRVYLSVERNG